MYTPTNRKERYGKKGFLTLEAAIALPVFLLAILTIASLMRFAYYEERAAFLAANELSEAAAKATFLPLQPGVPARVQRVLEEKIPELKSVAVEEYQYRAVLDGKEEQIAFTLRFDMTTGLPGTMKEGLSASEYFAVRAFCGKDNAHAALDSDGAPDSDIEAETVYLMPDYGRKYHTESCTYVNSYPLQTVMSKDLARKHKPCGICEPGKKDYGKTVYCFPYGGAYHSAGCSTIDKYVITMDRRDAEKRGYTRCSKCGGGR